MKLHQIKSRWDASVLFEAVVGSLKACVELAISKKITLRGAYLRGADLGGVKIDDLMCITDLQDAVDLAPIIFDFWKENNLETTQEKFGMYKIPGESRALVLMCPRFVGGYCFVLKRREIWWWSWQCPDPDTVPILWREKE